MGYFIISSPIAVSPTGTTVSEDGLLTADCQSVQASELTYGSVVMVHAGEGSSVGTVEISSMEVFGHSTREAVSVATSEQTVIDLGINTSQLLYFDPSFE